MSVNLVGNKVLNDNSLYLKLEFFYTKVLRPCVRSTLFYVVTPILLILIKYPM